MVLGAMEHRTSCASGASPRAVAAGRNCQDVRRASTDHPKLRAALDIPERYKILLIVALGKPAETVLLWGMVVPAELLGGLAGPNRWSSHHVLKRAQDELVARVYGG